MSDRNKGCEQSTFRPYLTPEQLAVRLQVSREYVYRELLGQADGIPAMKIGKGLRARWRIRPEDLEALFRFALMAFLLKAGNGR